MVNWIDTTWVLISTALVMLMTPTLAFFYGGLVRKKNVLSVLMQTFAILAVISIQWVIMGYSLAFGPDLGGVIGSLAYAGLSGVGMDPAKGTDDTAAGVRALSDDVRGHHAGAHHRRVHREDQVQRISRVHDSVDDVYLRSDGALGLVPRWLAREARSARFRRRYRHTYSGRDIRARNGAPPRQKERHAHRARSAQPAARGARRRLSLVRVVRVQRGERALGGAGHGFRVP